MKKLFLAIMATLCVYTHTNGAWIAAKSILGRAAGRMGTVLNSPFVTTGIPGIGIASGVGSLAWYADAFYQAKKSQAWLGLTKQSWPSWIWSGMKDCHAELVVGLAMLELVFKLSQFAMEQQQQQKFSQFKPGQMNPAMLPSNPQNAMVYKPTRR